ncbi:MAG: RluA family pseudouridine synthase [Hyphomicrobiales bacterium]
MAFLMDSGFFFHRRWPVIFEDNHLLALYKPAGLLVQGDESGEVCLLDLAKAWIKERHQKPGRVFLGLVHRLDRPVAGALVLARTSKAAGRLSHQIRTRQVHKLYLAVVEGRLPSVEGELAHHIERGERSSRIVEAGAPLGREARLSYRVRAAAGSRSLVEIVLLTGRKHQIRLQLAHIGCPIVGDVRYGASTALADRQIALFAKQIVLEHPTRCEQLSLDAPLPVGWPWPGVETDESPLWNWSEYTPTLRGSVLIQNLKLKSYFSGN